MTTFSKLANRNEFTEYCLRRLGKPMLNIEVTPDQIQDRVDDALQMYFDRHVNAIKEVWVVIPFTETDVTNGYVTLPEEVMDVLEVMRPSSYSSDKMDDPTYQFQQFWNMSGMTNSQSVIDYVMSMQHMDVFDKVFNPVIRFNYSKASRRLYVPYTDDYENYTAFCIHCYVTTSVEENINMWNDDFLKKYATALIKLQWGENISKFRGFPGPGGVELNGDRLIAEATAEKEKLEEMFGSKWEEPVIGIMFG